MATAADFKDIGKMSFEEALRELEVLVKKLEGGQIALEEAIGSYERGNALRKHCEKKLSEAKLKVEMIVKGEDGKPTLKEFAE